MVRTEKEMLFLCVVGGGVGGLKAFFKLFDYKRKYALRDRIDIRLKSNYAMRDRIDIRLKSIYAMRDRSFNYLIFD